MTDTVQTALEIVWRDTLLGGSGADSLSGSQALDFVRGYDGDDLVWGGGGFDDLHGNAGDDTVAGGDGGDWIEGGRGNDQLFGDRGDDRVHGGLGHDLGFGGEGDDLLSGNDGSDTLSGGVGDDEIHGGEGADRLFSGGGLDTIDGGAGDDLIVLTLGAGGSASAWGGDGDDTIVSGDGAHQISGGGGADRFQFVQHVRPAADAAPSILDWGSQDQLQFGFLPGATPSVYVELAAGGYAEALGLVAAAMADQGALYVAVQLGGDVVVFADVNGRADDGAEAAVVLVGRSLADIDHANIVG